MSAPYPPPGPPPGPPPAEPAKRRFSPGQITGAVLLLLMLIFVFENTRKVKVRLVIPEVTVPLYFALLLAAALGVVGTLMIQWRRGRKN